MDSRVRAVYKIDPDPEGPALARRIIAEELASRLPATTLDEIKLMVSELVTNGVVHGGGANDPVLLDVVINGNVRCRVLDRGPGFAARVQQSQDPGAGGWRLRVVEELSDCWGMQCAPDRTEVWFERACT
jgi:anti-sigma regulatory factor (Ser/Thr protein kinase)